VCSLYITYCVVCSSPLLHREREGVIQIGLLPFYHIYAVMVTFMMSLSWGQTTVVVPGFDPRLFLEIVPKYKVWLLFMLRLQY